MWLWEKQRLLCSQTHLAVLSERTAQLQGPASTAGEPEQKPFCLLPATIHQLCSDLPQHSPFSSLGSFEEIHAP